MENEKETLTVSQVAKRLGKNSQYMRELIKREMVPWGIYLDTSTRNNYLILKGRFEKWLTGETMI